MQECTQFQFISISMEGLLFLITFAWLYIVTAVEDNIQFHHLHDSRLCNNGNNERYITQKCITRPLPDMEKGVEYACDSRRLGPDYCRVAVLELESFTVKRLLEVIPNLDEDLTVRRIIIKLPTKPTPLADTSKEIDHFLAPRLWWYVDKEPYEWRDDGNQNIIVFSRVQHEFEHNLRILSAIQNPDSHDICAATPLLLIHRDFKHPGWYSMLVQYTSVHVQLPYAVSAVYVSNENSVHDSTSFITAEDCPNIVNKWECAFLPITNCTLPSVVSNCQGHDCVLNVVDDSIGVTAVFDKASEAGVNLPRSALQSDEKSKEYLNFQSVVLRTKNPPLVNKKLIAAIEESKRHKQPYMKYLKPYNPSAAPFQSMMFVDFDFYTYGLLLRPSAFYRSRIAQVIHEFRQENNFQSSDRCVAAQIRRGDRVLADKNITAFCLDPVNRNSDMGCSTVPFVSITLTHVIDKAAVLVDSAVRTLVVTTDDEKWLDEQREELKRTRPEWRVLNLKSPHTVSRPHSDVPAPLSSLRGDDKYKYMRYGAGTASGVLLHGSIEASRQCEAFVGHFGCGGTMLVYKSLCAQHNHREHVCPPSFDLRTIKELQIFKQP